MDHEAKKKEIRRHLFEAWLLYGASEYEEDIKKSIEELRELLKKIKQT